MIQAVASYAIYILFGCIALNLIRIVTGPSIADRAIAADAIFLNLVGIAALYSIYIQTPSYMDLVLVFSLLGFVGTVCMAKFIGFGRIIE